MMIAADRSAPGGLPGEELPELFAVLVEQRLGATEIVRHGHDLAANDCGMLAHIGIGDDQRLLDHGARARREEAVEATVKRRAATMATRTVGTAAMTANSPTICTWSRDPAHPRRRACTTTQTSRPMMASSSTRSRHCRAKGRRRPVDRRDRREARQHQEGGGRREQRDADGDPLRSAGWRRASVPPRRVERGDLIDSGHWGPWNAGLVAGKEANGCPGHSRQ